MAWAAVASAGVGLLGSKLLGPKQSGSQTATQQNQLDPRAAEYLYGKEGGNGGLLAHFRGLLDAPQADALQRFGQLNRNYLDGAASDAYSHIRNAGTDLINGGTRASLPAYARGNQVQAPSQNGMDLTASYDSLINGKPGANPFLTGAIQRGINQSTNAFQDMQRSSTQNLLEQVMPSIRSNSVLAGQYGGSRQGIAEGRALGDFATQQQQAISRFGQNNTDAAVSAQAGAYDADMNRRLAATQGLGAQQYGTAFQNAATKNAAEFMNVGNLYDASKFNAGIDLAGKQMGAGLLSGLVGDAYNLSTAQDNFGVDRASRVSGMMAPYLGMGGSTTTSQPIYENRFGNALGGISAGIGLYNQFKGMGTQGASGSNWTNIQNGWNNGTGY